MFSQTIHIMEKIPLGVLVQKGAADMIKRTIVKSSLPSIQQQKLLTGATLSRYQSPRIMNVGTSTTDKREQCHAILVSYRSINGSTVNGLSKSFQ
jgi:hypothetical protein